MLSCVRSKFGRDASIGAIAFTEKEHVRAAEMPRPKLLQLGTVHYAVISKTNFSIVRVSRSWTEGERMITPQLYGQDKLSEDVTLQERKEKHDGTTLRRPIKQQSQTDGLVMVVNPPSVP